MSAKEVKFHDNARNRIVAGVNILADAVKSGISWIDTAIGASRIDNHRTVPKQWPPQNDKCTQIIRHVY
jgi:hypothetical protein